MPPNTDTKGFYRLYQKEDKSFDFNFFEDEVLLDNMYLTKKEYLEGTLKLPVQGWYWFNSLEEAKNYYMNDKNLYLIFEEIDDDGNIIKKDNTNEVISYLEDLFNR